LIGWFPFDGSVVLAWHGKTNAAEQAGSKTASTSTGNWPFRWRNILLIPFAS
jgi:hypothetical protein